MSDLVCEPVQEPPDATNLGPPPSVDGVSDGVGSFFDSAKQNTAVTVTSPLSTKSQDLECVKSEQDTLQSEEGDAAAGCPVSKGIVLTVSLTVYFTGDGISESLPNRYSAL